MHSVLAGLNSSITYSKDNAGTEETESKISGTIWTKEIIVQKPIINTGYILGGNFYLGNSSGSVTAKIYVNDKLEVEFKQDAKALPVDNLSLASIGTYHQYAYN